MAREPDLFADFPDPPERSVAYSGPWVSQAMRALARVPLGFVGTAEEIGRVMCLSYGLAQPPDPHLWGALINRAKGAGLLVDTLERRAMRKLSSHGRSTTVYKRT